MSLLITPNTLARRNYPVPGHNKTGTRYGGLQNPEENLEQSTAKPPLDLMQRVVMQAQTDATGYYTRNGIAQNYFMSRWSGQTLDGRKWGTDGSGSDAWPWAGASDTRIRLCEKLVGQHTSVAKYSLMNQKVQAKSTRPSETAGKSQMATLLLNWALFTMMAEDNDLEHELALNWRHTYGSAVIEVCWEQESRLEYVPISIQAVQAKAAETGADPAQVEQFVEALYDPSMEEQFTDTIQQMSPIVTRGMARAIIGKLRANEEAEVPVPYVLKSQPRHTALRPMVDIFFPPQTGNLMRSRWIDRVEWITETELTGRIATAGYRKSWVEEAIEHKGRTSVNEDWRKQTQRDRLEPGDYGSWCDDEKELIEIHHFHRMALDRDVPTMECTVFHLNIPDDAGRHGPGYYAHGQYPFNGLRFEKQERALLSSRGIPEIAYTWENEIKESRDGRTDRNALAMRPPMFADYDEVLKLKMAFMPGVIYPKRRNSDIEYFKAPPWDNGAIEIEKAVERTVNEHFGLFGEEVDPQLKQIRQMELGDRILMEFKPIARQTWQLIQELMPDEVVQAICGKPKEQVSRMEIQGQYDLTATIDFRDLDKDWAKEKLGFITQMATMDRAGRIDWSEMIQIGFEIIDYTIAERALKPAQEVTNKEIEDEIDAVSKIVGSGIEQPMPEGSNYQLRLQTLQNTIQGSQSAQMALRQDENKGKVLMNRVKFFQFQLQQIQNAQVGRMGVQAADGNGEAPMGASPMGGMG